MPKAQASMKTGPDGEVWDRKAAHLTLSLYEQDLELLDFCQNRLGCSKSEVLRTGIRTLAMQLANIPIGK